MAAEKQKMSVTATKYEEAVSYYYEMASSKAFAMTVIYLWLSMQYKNLS